MIIGLPRGEVRVVPYQPGWKELYQEEAKLLRSVLKDRVLHLEHIGSTAIVGLDAKPIIDLMVAVHNLNETRILLPDLEQLGYEFRPDEPLPDRLYFAKGPREVRTHHLSITEFSSAFYTNQLLFRDYLRAHPSVAEEYRELKKNLAELYPTQRPLYTEGKTAFVERVLELTRTTK